MHAEFEAIRQTSGVHDGNQLQAASTAATVRVDGGQTQVTEGPAVEAGTQLDSHYIYDAPDLDAAVALAARPGLSWASTGPALARLGPPAGVLPGNRVSAPLAAIR